MDYLVWNVEVTEYDLYNHTMHIIEEQTNNIVELCVTVLMVIKSSDPTRTKNPLIHNPIMSKTIQLA